MDKVKFAEFLDYVLNYNFKEDVKCIRPRVLIKNTLISVILYTRDYGVIEYGDFTHKEFKKEFANTLIKDEYIDKDKNPLDLVDEITKWEFYLNLTDGYDVYSTVHLFDYTNEGVKFIGEASMII